MVGYLITTIEAATAAPLAVVQLLTPEGHGIVGTRLERSLQLVVVCILKPSLMIIGLLAAISISSKIIWRSSRTPQLVDTSSIRSL